MPQTAKEPNEENDEEVKAAKEKKKMDMITRLAFGVPMIIFFFLLVWLGHPYLCGFVVFLQVGLFRELVNVKYLEKKEKESRSRDGEEIPIPLFRTMQWCMFFLAMWQTYTKTFLKLGLVNSLMRRVPMLAPYIQDSLRYKNFFTFSAYVTMFVTFVITIMKESPAGIKKHLGHLVWTIAVLCLIVWQIAGTAHLIFNGLFWFMLPCGLVVANDCWAYFCGVSMAKKFIKAEFTALSPKKSWEGFIGGGILTLIWAWLYSDWISNSQWFICPQTDLATYADLSCTPSPLFQVQAIKLPYDDYTLLTINAKPVQLHAVLLGVFASIVAPFGGFFASAIKRAHNLKDFDSIVPGHGGLMDRMDCQFLMLLCTYIHFSTFVSDSIPNTAELETKILQAFMLLPDASRMEMIDKLKASFISGA